MRPENTIAAFREAHRLGADMVELDARRTADGGVAVHHDPVVPGSGPVSALRLTQLPPDVPTLAAALDACAGMGVNIELKNLPGQPGHDPGETLSELVVGVVAARAGRPPVLVSSFALASIDRVRALDADVPTALLTLPGYDQRSAIETCVAGGHVALHPHDHAVDPDLIEAAHDAGLAVNVWTVDDPARMRELVGWGVDGVCTNVPDVLVEVLRAPRG